MLYFYSIFIASMGTLGFAAAHSLLCLISAFACSVVIGISAYYIRQRWIAYGVTTLLMAYFSFKAFTSQYFFVNVLLLLVSIFVLAWPSLKKLRLSVVGLQRSSRHSQR